MTSPLPDPRAQIIHRAARWLADRPSPPPTHVVPTLRERFGFNALKACEAIALARNAPAPVMPEAPITEKTAEGGEV